MTSSMHYNVSKGLLNTRSSRSSLQFQEYEKLCRYLMDNATREGQEQILICFVYEHEKRQAQRILNTVTRVEHLIHS